MNINLTKKNILKIAILALLIGGLVVGVYLVQTKKIFKSKAYEDIGATPGELALYRAFEVVDANGVPLNCNVGREGRYVCYSKTRSVKISLRGNTSATKTTTYPRGAEYDTYYVPPSYTPSYTSSPTPAPSAYYDAEPRIAVTPTPQATPETANMVSAERICIARGDTNTNCLGMSGFSLNFPKCLEQTALQGQLFIGYRMQLPTGTEDRYFQFDPIGSDVQFATPGLGDLGSIYLGIMEWGQAVSLYNDKTIKLPANVSVIPITLQDSRGGSTKTYTINARKINYRPAPGICKLP